MDASTSIQEEHLLPALRPHRCLDAHLYILHLIQFGVMSGAERIRVRLLRSGAVEVLFPDLRPSFSLEKLIGALQPESQPSAGSALARAVLALRTAARLKPVELSWNMPNQAQLYLKDGSIEQRRADGPLGFRLKKKPQRWFQSWHGQEARLLNERCAWTPATLTVDGREVACSPWDRFRLYTNSEAWERKLGPCLVESFRQRRAAGLKVPGPPSSHYARVEECCRWNGKLPSSLWFRSQLHPQRFQADQEGLDGELLGDLGVALVNAEEGPSRLWMIQYGVALEPLEIDLGGPQLMAVVHAPEVSVDESGFQPLRDSASERLLEEVAAEGRALLEWFDSGAGGTQAGE